MPGADDTSTLLARIHTLEQQMRSLMATNWTDRASVVDASGHAVSLSDLAFGQAIAVNPAVGAVSFSTIANQGGPSSFDPANWTYSDPTVDVFVHGSRLRTDWAAEIAVNSHPSIPQLAMSYQIIYRGPSNDGSVNNVVVTPDTYRSIKISNPSATYRVDSFGAFYLHSGLTPGWYRVQAAWYLGYSSYTSASQVASADYPRIAATPL